MAKMRFITVSYESNLEQPGSLTTFPYPYDSIWESQGGGFALDTANGKVTFSNGGYYSISATANINNASYLNRVNFRTRLRINGSWIMGLPQSYSYARHSNYIPFATSTIPETIILLEAGDAIDIACVVSKNTNTAFSSTFDGIQFFHGGCLLLVRSKLFKKVLSKF